MNEIQRGFCLAAASVVVNSVLFRITSNANYLVNFNIKLNLLIYYQTYPIYSFVVLNIHFLIAWADHITFQAQAKHIRCLSRKSVWMQRLA